MSARYRWQRPALPAAAAIAVTVLAAAPGPRAPQAATHRVPTEFATIAEALAASASLDTVLVSPGVYVGDLVLPSNVSLVGDGPPESVVLAGAGTGSVVLCAGTGPATRLASLTLQGGVGTLDGSTRFGGAVYVRIGALRLEDVVVRGSQADLGGGVCADRSALHWSGGSLTDNSAGLGGGIVLFGGSHSLSRVHASGNQATHGGALYAGEVTLLTVDQCLWEGNAASGDGGGACLVGTAAVVTLCRFDRNSAGGRGGAWAVLEGSALNGTDCIFYENEALISGGGLHAGCDGAPGSACAQADLTRADLFRNHSPSGAPVAAAGAARVRLEAAAVAGNDTPPACLGTHADISLECCAVAVNGPPQSGPCAVAETDVVVLDPYLCDLDGGNLDRCSNSPLLLPTACSGVPYGALGLGCGSCGPTQSEASSWGRVKALYR